MRNQKIAILLALLAAALYAANVPFSKLLMQDVQPRALAGLLYLGAGVGMGFVLLIKKLRGRVEPDMLLSKADLPYTVAMVVLDIAAPVLLMLGLSRTTAANASLLNNLEIVFTSLIAWLIFRERISARLWAAIALVTAAGILLGLDGAEGFVFHSGSLLVLGACLCWGLENNCTRSISSKSAEQIVMIKGIFSGIGSLAIAVFYKERLPSVSILLAALLLGFVSYGVSITCYIMAQNRLGAAKTGAFYSVAPFLGVGFGFVLLSERPGYLFYMALAVMVIGTVIMVKDSLRGEV